MERIAVSPHRKCMGCRGYYLSNCFSGEWRGDKYRVAKNLTVKRSDTLLQRAPIADEPAPCC